MTARRWLLAAFLVTVVVSGVLVWALAGQEGAGIVAVLAVPVLVTAVPLLVTGRGRRGAGWGSVVVLAVLVILGMFSVGAAYLPSLALLTIGVAGNR